MKRISIISLLVILVAFWSCEDYSAIDPSVDSFTVISQTTEGSAVDVEVKITGAADNMVVWWGDPASDYAAYVSLTSNPAAGENVTNTYPAGQSFSEPVNWDGANTITHTYDTTGTYTIVVIASSNGNFSADNKHVEFTTDITVQY